MLLDYQVHITVVASSYHDDSLGFIEAKEKALGHFEVYKTERLEVISNK